jgi:hypothetical protein
MFHIHKPIYIVYTTMSEEFTKRWRAYQYIHHYNPIYY